ncbi:MAG: alpha/beta fold hydrolase [Gammaproteobacteria bacterium]|nr:alpha/beta fold hydrolase [Gammaproteobacteria bacterium]
MLLKLTQLLASAYAMIQQTYASPFNYSQNDLVLSPHINWLPECPEGIHQPKNSTFDCGWLQVPIDHDHYETGTLSLLIGKHNASNPVDKKGSWIMKLGGPWLDDVATLGYLLDQMSPKLQASFDIVVLNNRGTYNNPISCHSSNISVADLDRRIWNYTITSDSLPRLYDLAAYRNSLCHYPKLADYMSTVQSTKDVEWLRQALGVDKINGIGFSAGTILMTKYYQLFTKHVDKLILDGTAVVLDNNLMGIIRPAPMEKALKSFFVTCIAAKEHCPLYLKNKRDTVSAMYSAYDELLSSPPIGLNISMIKLATWFGVNNGAYYRPFPELCGVKNSPNTWTFYAIALTAAIDQRDPSTLICAFTFFSPDFPKSPNDVSIKTAQTDFTNSVLTKEQWLNWTQSACEHFPRLGCESYIQTLMKAVPGQNTTTQPLWDRELPTSASVKIMILTNTIDPNTPMNLALQLFKTLKPKVATALIVKEVTGHDTYLRMAYKDPCIEDQVSDFLLEDKMPTRTFCPGKNPFMYHSAQPRIESKSAASNESFGYTVALVEPT